MAQSEKVYKWVCKSCGNVNFAISLDDVYCDACQKVRTDEEFISLESEGQDATTPPPTYEPPVVPVEPNLPSSEENVYAAEERELSSREAAPSGIYAVGDILSAAGAETEDSEEDTETDVAEEVVDYAPAVAPTPAPVVATPEPVSFCPYCGSRLTVPATKFCPNCGGALSNASEGIGTTSVVAPMPVVIPEATSVSTSSAEKAEGKNNTLLIGVLILLAVGLGGYVMGLGGKKEAMPAASSTYSTSQTTTSQSQSSTYNVPSTPVTVRQINFSNDYYIGTFRINQGEYKRWDDTLPDGGKLFGTRSEGFAVAGNGGWLVYRRGQRYTVPGNANFSNADIYKVTSEEGLTVYILTTCSKDSYGRLKTTVLGVDDSGLTVYAAPHDFQQYMRRLYGARALEGRVTGVWADGSRIKLSYEIDGGDAQYFYLDWDASSQRLTY